MNRALHILAMLACLSFISGHCFAADELEKKLLTEIPGVMAKLKEQGTQNVGVLKFRVKIGSQPASDRVGTLNTRLAEKVELALVLANKVQSPIGIIHHANRTAATIKGASHLTTEGRKLLFNSKYPMAWGTDQVTPDALITGVAVVSADLRTMTVSLQLFTKQNMELNELLRFEVPVDLEQLLDAGESFTVRGVFDNSNLQLTANDRKDKAITEVIKTSLETKSETSGQSKPSPSKLHPLSANHPDSPITIDVFYNNQLQKIEFRNGAAFLAEPQQGQKVHIVIKRKGTSRERLGIVLKVNGESTLFAEKSADPQCALWIMEPDRNEIKVTGYQLDNNKQKEFRVLSQTESKTKEIDYGDFVGTISVSVFREQKTPPKTNPQLALTDEGEDFNILKRGSFPETAPGNLGALRQQLAQSSTRGLVGQGPVKDSKIQLITFTRDDIPVMSASIKYYSSQDLPPE